MSRSNSTNAHYDENLLNAAPQVGKRDIQAGYDADILRDAEKPLMVPVPTSTTRDLEAAHPVRPSRSGSRSDLDLAGPKHLSTKKPKPFWKTRKGIIVIAVVFILIVVGAVVGGVVGSNKSDDPAPQQTTPANPSSGEQSGSTNTQDPNAPNTRSPTQTLTGTGTQPAGADTPTTTPTLGGGDGQGSGQGGPQGGGQSGGGQGERPPEPTQTIPTTQNQAAGGGNGGLL